MNAPHVIRLRGPWQRSVLNRSELPSTAPPDATVTMPTSWTDDLGPTFQGTIEYRRFFNQPTGIDDSTRLRLALEHVIGYELVVGLNGKVLGKTDEANGRLSFDIAGCLRKRNDLRVRIATGPRPAGNAEAVKGGLVGEVRLEIG